MRGRSKTASMVSLCALFFAGCIYSNENGEWGATPVYTWKCPKEGYHGFVSDPEGLPLRGVFVQFRPRPTGDVAEATDSNHAGAWEMCRRGGVDATITFDKTGYRTHVIQLRGRPDTNGLNVTLQAA